MDPFMKMIKMIGFDLGGVYLTDCWSFAIRKRIAKEFHVPFELINKRHKRYIRRVRKGLMNEKVFLNNLFRGTGVPIPKVKRRIRELNAIQYPETGAIIRKLVKRYKVVAMNNEGKEWNTYRIARFHLRSLFDKMLSSCILHKEKPTKAYYRLVLKRLRISPKDLVFIDNREDNVTAAAQIGINAIHFRSPKQLKQDLWRLEIKV